jgi:hydroxypyruvate isomerase
MSYIILRGRWFHIIVLNVLAPTEDKTDDVKDSFYEELEHIFNKFPKYHMNILLGDLNAKVGREDIFKPTIGNESLHKIINDNGVRVVYLPHLKISLSKVQCSHIATFINILGHLQMGTPTIRLTIF